MDIKYSFTKEADGFVSGIINQVKDNLDFKNHPFKNIFAIFGIAYAWRFGWVVGALFTGAELNGYGPGYIGNLIDEYFHNNGAKDVNNFNLSENNIAGAAEHATNTILNVFTDKNIKNVTSSNMALLYDLKGNLTKNDVKTAIYMTANTNMVKLAGFFDFLKLWKSGQRGGFIKNALMTLIGMFSKGLLALGIGAGISSMLGMNKEKEEAKQIEQRPSNLSHYSNVNYNVKETLITFLNATIANFEIGFKQLQKNNPIPLEVAPGWTKILNDIQKYNWVPINQVNDFTAFVAPPITEIAKILLDSVNARNVQIERIQQQALPKKPTNDEELGRLLKGEM